HSMHPTKAGLSQCGGTETKIFALSNRLRSLAAYRLWTSARRGHPGFILSRLAHLFSGGDLVYRCRPICAFAIQHECCFTRHLLSELYRLFHIRTVASLLSLVKKSNYGR